MHMFYIFYTVYCSLLNRSASKATGVENCIQISDFWPVARTCIVRLLEISGNVPSPGVNAANAVARQATAAPAAKQPAGKLYC